MALQDILDAIQAEAAQNIADAKTAHQRRLSALREESERRIAALRQRLAALREEKKTQLRMKAETMAIVERRNALLRKKQELLNRFYETDVVQELTRLPKEKQEALVQSYVAKITEKGTIHPAAPHEALLRSLVGDRFTIGSPVQAAGGFLFVSPREERDCTYEHIVSSELRPQSEVAVSHALFHS